MLTMFVTHDREPINGGASSPTKLSVKTFPYFADPNTELQNVVQRVELNAAPDTVWSVIGKFGGYWHPLIADIKLIGAGIGELRVVETVDGKQIIERLEALDDFEQVLPILEHRRHSRVKLHGDTRSQAEWRWKFCRMARGIYR